MPRELLFVFSYDVAKDSTRRKVSDRLGEDLARVQKSVFEGTMTRQAAQRLSREVQAMIEDSDSLRVYAVSPVGRKNSFVHGGAPLMESNGFWLL